MSSIKIEDFYTCQKKLIDAGIFKEKSAHLQITYKCFSDKEKTFIFKPKYVQPSAERPEKIRIGVRDLSREHLAKKEFMSLLNKLSDQNKKQIYATFKTSIRIDFYKLYINMTWAMILKFPEFQKLYINLITILYENMENKKSFIDEWLFIINDYEVTKKWIPADNILDDKDYDEFCDFQKWKKQSSSATNCLKILSENAWIYPNTIKNIYEKMIADCDNYFELSNGVGCKIVDAILDQINEICDIINDKLIIDFINKWLSGDVIRASSKFKLLDMKEKLEIKLSKTYKVKYR